MLRGLGGLNSGSCATCIFCEFFGTLIGSRRVELVQWSFAFVLCNNV